MPQETNQLYEFGPFQADTLRRLLLREGQPVPVTSKAFDTLVALIRNRDRVMEKDELLKTVWPDSFVEEANLAQNVSSLRKALGDQPGENRYIATVPGKGYRFVGAVRVPTEPATEVVASTRTTTEVVIEEEVEARVWPYGKIAAVAVGLLVLVAVGFWWGHREPEGADAAKLRSLAVLPFQQLTPSAGDEYLGLGLADAVITRLSNVRQLVVRPTSAVLRYQAPPTDSQTPGKDLRVDAVLDGKVQKAGDRVRVTVQLIRVEDGRPLWAQTFDESFTSIFGVEDSISEKVAQTLAVKMAPPERHELARHYTENVEAYRNYLKGRTSYCKFTREGLNEAVEFFNSAIARDPSYALAYAGLADAYTTASEWVLAPRDALSKAESASRKALAFDERLSEAHGALGHSLMHQWKLKSASVEFQRALELTPNNTSIYFAYAEYLTALKKPDEAVAQLQKALTIDPLSIDILGFMAWPLFLKHDFEGVIETARKALAVNPDYWVSHMALGMACHALKRYPEALKAYQRARELNPESTMLMANIARLNIALGKRADALKILDEMKRLRQKQYVSPFDISLVYAELGERDEVFQWLGKAFDDQSEMMMYLRDMPELEGYRGDPRFQDLVKRVQAAEPL